MKPTTLLSLAAVLIAAACTGADATANGALRVTFHHEKAAASHSAPAAVLNAKKFAKLAHMKATPWESEPKVKAAKCEDMCFLRGFYTFQEGRNCYSRPTDLCMQYKLGKVALEAVLVTAECECSDDASSAAGSADDDNSDETVELPTDA